MCFLFLKTVLRVLPRNRYISTSLLGFLCFLLPLLPLILGNCWCSVSMGDCPRTRCGYQTPLCSGLSYKRRRTIGPRYLRVGIHRWEVPPVSTQSSQGCFSLRKALARHIPDTLFTQRSPASSTCHSRLSTAGSKLIFYSCFLLLLFTCLNF